MENNQLIGAKQIMEQIANGPINPDAATPEQFETALASWLIGCQEIINKFWKDSNYTHSLPPVLKIVNGKRYAIVRRHDWRNEEISPDGSAFAFIDKTGGDINGVLHRRGDVLKAASYRAPAIHARGNIFDDKNGLAWMRWTGPETLR